MLIEVVFDISVSEPFSLRIVLLVARSLSPSVAFLLTPKLLSFSLSFPWLLFISSTCVLLLFTRPDTSGATRRGVSHSGRRRLASENSAGQ